MRFSIVNFDFYNLISLQTLYDIGDDGDVVLDLYDADRSSSDDHFGSITIKPSVHFLHFLLIYCPP